MRRFKWKIANVLSRWAIRLRGQKVYSTDMRVEGNQASALKDRIWLHVVMLGVGDTRRDKELRQEISDDLDWLSQLAGETWNYERKEGANPPLEPSWFIKLAKE
jgi:hypothetical protein